MAGVDGDWDCITKSPLGEQKSVFTVRSNGDTFTGQQAGAMGSLDVVDGKVDGNKLAWSANITSPMPMTLDFTGNVEGDKITGSVKAGAFGSFPFTGGKTA